MNIVTVTANPAVDISTSVARLIPIHKMRCSVERRDPGGGGINVARVVARLGGDVAAIYPIGGPTGELLRRLIDREGVFSLALPISRDTREDLTILDELGSCEYRFVMPGPALMEAEWRSCLDVVASLRGNPAFIVASGSLPPGVPVDFYARLARLASRLGARYVLDTSGQALQAALAEGVYLIKPSLRELSELTGLALAERKAQLDACRELINSKNIQVVALTLGNQGAVLIAANSAWSAEPLRIEPVSSVGAGDSFLGGMIWSLASGHRHAEALRWGVAAGSAALLGFGTELGSAVDVSRFYQLVNVSEIKFQAPLAKAAG